MERAGPLRALLKRPALPGLGGGSLVAHVLAAASTTPFSESSCSLFGCFMFWCSRIARVKARVAQRL